MKYNILQEKSFAFAVRIVKLYKFLCEEQAEELCKILSKIIITTKNKLIKNLLILNSLNS